MSYYDDNRDAIEWRRELDDMGFPVCGAVQMVCVQNDCDWHGNPVVHTPLPEYVPRVRTPQQEADRLEFWMGYFSRDEHFNDVDIESPHYAELLRRRAIAER